MSTYTGVTNFQKTVRFFGPPCTPRFGTPVTTADQEMEWALLLQPRSPHAPCGLRGCNNRAHSIPDLTTAILCTTVSLNRIS